MTDNVNIGEIVIQDVIQDAHIVENFCILFDMIQRSVHANAVAKGFWEAAQEDGTKIALMHSELSEALEAIRKPDLQGHLSDKGINLLTEELADVIIRIMDFAEHTEMPLAEAIIYKAQYNTTRERLHGKTL